MRPAEAPASADHHVVSAFADACDKTFDFVFLGGGGTAAAFLHAVLTESPDARVLILEQGAFLVPSHVQNLGLAYQPLMASASASPWRSVGDLEVVAQVPFLGGRTLVWSGSCPRPTREQLSEWPASVVDELGDFWEAASEWLGVRPATELGVEFGSLHSALRLAASEAISTEPSLLSPVGDRTLDAPLAHPRHVSGALQKFSAIVPLLESAAAYPETVTIVTNCAVEELEQRDGRVVAIRTSRGTLRVDDSEVILGMGTTESTRLVLASGRTLPSPNAGLNFAANCASFFTCRVPRSAFSGLADHHAELAALYVDGSSDNREFHLHVSAVATSEPARDLKRIYHLMPDMFGDGTPERVSDPDHVVLIIHGLSEVAGKAMRPTGSRISIGVDGVTEGDFQLDSDDHAAWNAMDSAVDVVLRAVAGSTPVEYWSDVHGAWTSEPPKRRMPFAFHETGTLWMGEDPQMSVTDVFGKIHDVANVYVLGGATFPTRGSWNPFLTMTALSFRLARRLTHKRMGSVSRPSVAGNA